MPPEYTNNRKSIISGWTEDSSNNMYPMLGVAFEKYKTGKNSSEIYWSLPHLGVPVTEPPEWMVTEVGNIYNETQAYYKKYPKKLPSTFYRSVRSNPVIESPLSSWSSLSSTTKKFGPILLTQTVPAERILMSYDSMKDLWPESDVKGKKNLLL